MCVCVCEYSALTNLNFIAKILEQKLRNSYYLEEFVQGERNYLELERDMKVISSCTRSVIDGLFLRSFPANEEKNVIKKSQECNELW